MATVCKGERSTNYAIVAFLDIDASPRVEELHSKHDPLAQHVAAHLTLVYPFSTALALQ